MKKAKKRVGKKLWSMLFDCEVEVISNGHFPTTLMIKLPDGKEVEADLDYLATLKKDRV